MDRPTRPSPTPAGLWHHADFLRLWAAQAVSAFGARITRTALPIIAVATLHQPEAIVSLLAALQLAPGVVVALFAGGFIDRNRKRPILIHADLFRAAVLGSLTVAWAFGVLSMVHVIIVGALVGAASALFQITDVAYLPTLVRREQLAEGNAKLEATEAVAEVTGPASAGALIAALGAPIAVVLDALSYVWSAMFLHRIRTQEEPPRDAAESASASAAIRGHDLRVGLRAIFRHPIVRPIVLSYMVWSISGGFFMALYTLFLLRELGLSEATFGIIVSMGGLGSFAGAFVSRRFVRSLGLGRAMILTSFMSLACAILIPLAGGPLAASFGMTLAFLCAHQLLSDGFSIAFVIQAVTLRQTVLPKHVLGRANAAFHLCTSGILPVAALVAGLIAELAGTRAAVWVGVLVGLAAPAFLWPLRKLRELPAGPT
ncbi:MAG: MFS transporter [Deltaproteobacteria bacterium]|nr:MFS transporter [Deltaproteobacteria bacterium]